MMNIVIFKVFNSLFWLNSFIAAYENAILKFHTRKQLRCSENRLELETVLIVV